MDQKILTKKDRCHTYLYIGLHVFDIFLPTPTFPTHNSYLLQFSQLNKQDWEYTAQMIYCIWPFVDCATITSVISGKQNYHVFHQQSAMMESKHPSSFKSITQGKCEFAIYLIKEFRKTLLVKRWFCFNHYLVLLIDLLIEKKFIMPICDHFYSTLFCERFHLCFIVTLL